MSSWYFSAPFFSLNSFFLDLGSLLSEIPSVSFSGDSVVAFYFEGSGFGGLLPKIKESVLKKNNWKHSLGFHEVEFSKQITAHHRLCHICKVSHEPSW